MKIILNLLGRMVAVICPSIVEKNCPICNSPIKCLDCGSPVRRVFFQGKGGYSERIQKGVWIYNCICGCGFGSNVYYAHGDTTFLLCPKCYR